MQPCRSGLSGTPWMRKVFDLDRAERELGLRTALRRVIDDAMARGVAYRDDVGRVLVTVDDCLRHIERGGTLYRSEDPPRDTDDVGIRRRHEGGYVDG